MKLILDFCFELQSEYPLKIEFSNSISLTKTYKRLKLFSESFTQDAKAMKNWENSIKYENLIIKKTSKNGVKCLF